MPRAIGAFRQAGVPVEAYPVDYQTFGSEDLRRFSGSLSGGIVRVDSAVHEWPGLFVLLDYRADSGLLPKSLICYVRKSIVWNRAKFRATVLSLAH